MNCSSTWPWSKHLDVTSVRVASIEYLLCKMNPLVSLPRYRSQVWLAVIAKAIVAVAVVMIAILVIQEISTARLPQKLTSSKMTIMILRLQKRSKLLSRDTGEPCLRRLDLVLYLSKKTLAPNLPRDLHKNFNKNKLKSLEVKLDKQGPLALLSALSIWMLILIKDFNKKTTLSEVPSWSLSKLFLDSKNSPF